MIVTDISEYKKGKDRVYIDGEYAFILYRGELKTYGIDINKEISEDVYTEIMTQVLVKRARLRAMNLLMKHRFTEKQLRNKLQDGEYPGDIVDNALEYVISYGYVDDRAYVEDYVFCNKENKSTNRIKNDLLSKGVDKDIINQVLQEVAQSVEPIDEVAQIRHLLEKKHFDSEKATYEETQKICAFLMRKGFGISTIRQSLQSLDITSD